MLRWNKVNRNWRLFIRSLVAVGLLFFLLRRLDYASLKSIMSSVSVWPILVSGALFYPGVLLSVARWRLFLKYLGLNAKYWKLVNLYLAAAFLNNFLPGSIGGDIYKVSRLPHGFSKTKILVSLLFDRGSGLLAVLFIQMFLLPIYYEPAKFLFAIPVLLMLVILVIWRYRRVMFLKFGWLQKPYFQNIAIYAKSLSAMDIYYLSGFAAFYSLAFLLNIVFGRYLLFAAFDVYLSPLFLLFAVTFVQLISFIPVSINAIGLAEGASVFVFSIVGVPAEVSLSVALIGRVSMMLASSIGSLFLFHDHSKSSTEESPSGER